MKPEEFKKIRLEMNFTQAALAKHLGISRSNIIRYEGGAMGVSNTIGILLAILATRHHKKRKAPTS